MIIHIVTISLVSTDERDVFKFSEILLLMITTAVNAVTRTIRSAHN